SYGSAVFRTIISLSLSIDSPPANAVSEKPTRLNTYQQIQRGTSTLNAVEEELHSPMLSDIDTSFFQAMLFSEKDGVRNLFVSKTLWVLHNSSCMLVVERENRSEYYDALFA
ncbi:hypothetical protein V8G54_013550, partial [Vigna mungo]